MKKIIITGSSGLIGKELCRYFKKKFRVLELDIVLGHDLTDEKFVRKQFAENHADYLVNCFALNDPVDKKKRRNTLSISFTYSKNKSVLHFSLLMGFLLS